MTVRELIDQLQKLPADKRVLSESSSGSFTAVEQAYHSLSDYVILTHRVSIRRITRDRKTKRRS